MKKHSSPIFDKIETSKQLPSLPHILLKLIEVCNKEETKITEISQIISKDSSLSARVMVMVNSVYYNLPNKVTSIGQALVLLGTDTIKNIAISASIKNVFKGAKDKLGFDLKAFWWHSLMCAILSKSIAVKIAYNSPDEAFLAGLLHDIGKLVLWINFTDEYKQIIDSSNKQTDLLLAGEIQLGASHPEVGSWLIKQWKLQSFISDAVLYHHEPLPRILNAIPLIKIVYVANIMSIETNENSEVNFKAAKEIFGFSSQQLEEINSNAREEIEHIAQFLGINVNLQENKEINVSDREHKIQDHLAQKVEEATLLHGTLQNLLKAHDENAILRVVSQALQILFDLKIVLFFLYDQEKNALIGKSAGSNNKFNFLDGVLIPFQEGKGLLVNSLKQGAPTDSFNYFKNDSPTIIDELVIRLTGRDGVMILPMVVQKQYIGIIVVGLNETRVSHLRDNLKLLSMISDQAAIALYAYYLRQNQAKLILDQRLKDTSTIARKVVHEVNTPLSIIKNYTKIMETKLAEKGIDHEELRIINEEINRVVRLLRGLYDFSEVKLQKINTLDINTLLSEVVRVFKKSLLIGTDIDIHLNLWHSLPLINTDKDKLKQVFINLIQNAVESMPTGGNLYITTKYTSNTLSDKFLKDMKGAMEYVEIAFIDEGSGIPDNLKSRLFDPFVTSKGGKHSGLGLSIVYNIIKELKGNITFVSDGKSGTEFKIVLPI
jgi:HD-like signal output (HDOD) protein/signal transduction histidine kinase